MNLTDLQATPHSPLCISRASRAGEDGLDFGTTDVCSCGLNDRLRELGDRARRDGPSVRPNWPRSKQ